MKDELCEVGGETPLRLCTNRGRQWNPRRAANCNHRNDALGWRRSIYPGLNDELQLEVPFDQLHARTPLDFTFSSLLLLPLICVICYERKESLTHTRY
jgi:hypothetical protein